MTNITIQKITVSNVDQLQSISKQTFTDTFALVNTKENLEKYLKDHFSKEKLITELNNNNTEFYFATLDDKIIGYLKLNFGPAQTELQDDKALEIERIYVVKELHGKNVGQLLYNKAIERARENKVDYLWLGVWEKNERAIHFYKKNGFVIFDTHLFVLGEEEQTDFMMKLQLEY